MGSPSISPSGTSTAGTTADTVTSSTGTIDATYTAKGCSGPDVITATAAVASANLTATGTVTVAAATIGSIQFESATPASIGLKGTGLNETSTVVFKVVDSTGGARAGRHRELLAEHDGRRTEPLARQRRLRPPTVRCRPS